MKQSNKVNIEIFSSDKLAAKCLNTRRILNAFEICIPTQKASVKGQEMLLSNSRCNVIFALYHKKVTLLLRQTRYRGFYGGHGNDEKT